MRFKGSLRRICPLRLAVPEKNFALLACSFFSTAAGAPPRCIRHWQRSAPHPLPLPPVAGEGPSGQITSGSNFRLGIMPSCYWFAVVPNKIRRRHLESVSAALYGRCQASFVSSRSLAVRGSWGTAPSVFLYGAPGGTQGPPGKGGAAERWRVTPSVSGVTRHGAQPATTRTYKSRAPAAIRTDRHLLVTPPRRRRPPFGLKTLFPTFLHRKASPAARRI